jgi:hypothetical protein
MNASVAFDRRLLEHDVRGSTAHARMLAARGLLTEADADAIAAGLARVQARLEAGELPWDPALEDVHMNVDENRDVADTDFRNDAVDAGEIGAGHQVTALHEVELQKTITADRTPTDPLLTVRVRHKEPKGSKASEQAFPFASAARRRGRRALGPREDPDHRLAGGRHRRRSQGAGVADPAGARPARRRQDRPATSTATATPPTSPPTRSRAPSRRRAIARWWPRRSPPRPRAGRGSSPTWPTTSW